MFNGAYKYDLVLTDIGMPVMNGNDVARHIRTSEKHHTPVLAITGLCDSHFQSNLFNMVLEKPLNLKRLKSTLESLIQ